MDREGVFEAVDMQLKSLEHVIGAETLDMLPEVVITFNTVAGCWVVKARYPDRKPSAPDGLVQELIETKSELANTRADLDRLRNQSQASKDDALVNELIATKGSLASVSAEADGLRHQIQKDATKAEEIRLGEQKLRSSHDRLKQSNERLRLKVHEWESQAETMNEKLQEVQLALEESALQCDQLNKVNSMLKSKLHFVTKKTSSFSPREPPSAAGTARNDANVLGSCMSFAIREVTLESDGEHCLKPGDIAVDEEAALKWLKVLPSQSYSEKRQYKLKDEDGSGVMFEFEEHAPDVFACIRNRYGISHADFIKSVGLSQFEGGAVGEGKSGMFFFFSHDRKYIAKTLKAAEFPFFLKVLHSYYQHLRHRPHSLLPHFYGLYKIKLPAKSAVQFVVMNNLFDSALPIHDKYDLKGSTVQRYVAPRDVESGVTVLKDLNFSCDGLGEVPSEIPLEHKKIYCGSSGGSKSGGSGAGHSGCKEELLAAIRDDAAWLQSNNIMDYSLLLGVCRHTPGSDYRTSSSPPLLHGGRRDYNPLPNSLTIQEQAQARVRVQTERTDTGAGSSSRGFAPRWEQERGGLRARNSDGSEHAETYFLGIIDVLQEYDIKKWLEHEYKKNKQKKMGQDPQAISAVKSSTYAKAICGLHLAQCYIETTFI